MATKFLWYVRIKTFFVLGDGAAKLSVMVWKQIALQLMVG